MPREEGIWVEEAFNTLSKYLKKELTRKKRETEQRKKEAVEAKKKKHEAGMEFDQTETVQLDEDGNRIEGQVKYPYGHPNYKPVIKP